MRAQVEGAKWNLDKTTVRAPADGDVTNLALRKGARVSNLSATPVMAFIDTSQTILVVQVPQIYARYIATGQGVEVTFKFLPSQVFSGKVEAVLQAISSGQTSPSGTAIGPIDTTPLPCVARVTLDDPKLAARLPAGSTGAAAIYTDHVKPTHVIRKVVLRETAILNYVWPF